MPIAEIIGFCAGTLGLIYAVPQNIKVYRTQETIGISIQTWILLLISHSLWAGYGVATKSPSQIVTNVIALFLVVALVGALLGWNLKTVAILILLSIVPFTVMQFSTAWLISVFLIGITLIARVPQVVRSYGTWKNHRGSAVSIATWTLAFSSTALWVVYAFIDHRYTVVLTASLSIIASVLIVAFETSAQRNRKDTFPELSPESAS